jgi:hypothetical protein
LSSPNALAEASLEEVRVLANALELPVTAALVGAGGPELPPRALSALGTAAELQAWDGQHTVNLLKRATLELAQGGTRRLVFNEATDWIDFDDA